MNSPLLNKVATAKRIVKEVLLIGGPGDGCRMPVNLNMKEVNVIDDDGEQHVYRKMTLESGGCFILFIHDSMEEKDVLRQLIHGRHRPVARTVWLQPLGQVDRHNVPIATDPALGLTTTWDYYDHATTSSELSGLYTELQGDLVSFGPDNDGSGVIITNPEGEKSASIMDGAGRTVASGMVSKVDETLVTWNTITHDTLVLGLLETKTTSALGNENKVQTDGAGRRIKVIDAEDNDIEFEYDNNSNLVYSIDANNVETFCDFDELNRDILCKDTVENSLSVNRQKVYDINNNLVKVIDTKGKFDLIAYDARNRKSNYWDRLVTTGYDVNNLPPVEDSTRFYFDANSNVTSIIDVQEKTTAYEFDSRNLQTKVTYPDHITGQNPGDANYGITECKYDVLGRREFCIDQKGDTVTYYYDLASRLQTREYHYANNNLESTDTFDYDYASRLKEAVKGRYS